MADGVDAAVNGMQPRPVQAHLDRPGPDPRGKQLPPRDEPVLSLRQPGNPVINITRPAFAPYYGVNAVFVRHEDDGAVGWRASGARNVPSRSRTNPQRRKKTRLQPADAASGFDP